MLVVIYLLFQSTLPREERRVRAFTFLWIISFQSTLPREERRTPPVGRFNLVVYFNPRSHERSDHTCTNEEKEATKYFNPRSHERSDRRLVSIYYKDDKFQSTLPREERQRQTRQMLRCTNFNPRSHERSDRKAHTAGYL